MQEYLIEEFDPKNGSWFIHGSCRGSGEAQSHMRGLMRIFPKTAFRVTENPSRRLIVCHDPNN